MGLEGLDKYLVYLIATVIALVLITIAVKQVLERGLQ